MTPANTGPQALRIEDRQVAWLGPHVHGVGYQYGVGTLLRNVTGVILKPVPAVDGMKVRHSGKPPDEPRPEAVVPPLDDTDTGHDHPALQDIQYLLHVRPSPAGC